jgi:hypothetical protein
MGGNKGLARVVTARLWRTYLLMEPSSIGGEVEVVVAMA